MDYLSIDSVLSRLTLIKGDMKNRLLFLFGGILFSVFGIICNDMAAMPTGNGAENLPKITETSLIVLGTVQDGGSPHIACTKDCCRDLFLDPDKNRKVVSLGLIDPEYDKKFLFEATPDLPEQMKILKNYSSFSEKETPDAIFLTHAHIGHYTGLMLAPRSSTT